MKQVVRRVIDSKGVVRVEDVPRPLCGPDQVLVQSHFTLISSGTELATLSKTPLELTRQVLHDPWMRGAVKDLLLQGDLKQTYARVYDELHLFRVLGYSGAGRAVEVGANVTEVKPGDLVAFAAQGHAEMVCPARNHVVALPEAMDLRHAAFVTVGGIAIQGVRRAQVELGQVVALIGLGLVGQIVAQVLTASGARVIGIDVSKERMELCRQLGTEHVVSAADADPVNVVRELTQGHGADATIICAASPDSAVANQAMEMTRKQGRVVAVGIVKMELERMPFFLRELDFVFSRAYGPGSYDPAYEKGRVDYPYHYVRWTEQRNLAEFIRLAHQGRVRVGPLIGGVVPVQEAASAYAALGAPGAGIATLLSYEDRPESNTRTVVRRREPRAARVQIGVLGAGNFTRGTLLPLLARHPDCRLRAICSAGGLTASSAGQRYDVDYVTSDAEQVLSDPEIQAVVIGTRHHLHAPLVIRAARAGKHVFVEKPFALDPASMLEALRAVRDAGTVLMVGYNRRHSSLSERLRAALPPTPRMLHYLTSIRPVPAEHWTLDEVEGGGRLVGEAEHFFDLANFLVPAAPLDVQAVCAGGEDPDRCVNFGVTVRFADSSIAQFLYTARGHAKHPRETLRVFCGGVTGVLEDFRRLKIHGKRVWRPLNSSDMGHRREIEQFIGSIVSGLPDDGLGVAAHASAVSLAAKLSLERNAPVRIAELLPEAW